MKQLNLHGRDIAWLAISLLIMAAVVGLVGNQQVLSRADDIEEINELIDDFQEAYSNKQVSELRPLFLSNAVIACDGSEGTRQRSFTVDDWLQMTQENVFDENDYISDVLSNREIEVYRNIAYAVCDYNYNNDNINGRGVDILTFIRMRDRWRIVSLQWTGDEVEKH